VSINWLLQRPRVTSVILGARTVEQLRDNLGAAGWDLAAEDMQHLDEISAPARLDYPYGFIDDANRTRLERLRG
jgi:aryl-alcohol dehydrogenase-like predicted oxidoreductase